jgi:ribosomal protein S18 acetylase RimI-like enzyme
LPRAAATVVPLRPGESDRAGALIARAFNEDPLASHLFPAEGERNRLAPRLFSASVRYDELFGHVDRTRDFRAVASWQPPGGPGETPERRARAGFADLPGDVPLVRLEAVLETISAAVVRAAPGPHWHLRLLAVDPDTQGRGLGAALLRYGLGRADASGRSVTLETFAERAARFYLGHGFEVLVDGVEPVSGLEFWALHRPAPH